MTCTSLLFGGEKNKWFLSRVSLILYLSFSLSFSISLRLFHFLFFLPPFLVWLFTEKTLWLVSISDKTNKQLVKLQKKRELNRIGRPANFSCFFSFFFFSWVDSYVFLCCVSVAWLAKYILLYASISCGESSNRLFDELPCVPIQQWYPVIFI